MAITITSLTPVNPSTPAGGTISFSVSATDSNAETLSYEWQFSSNGGNSYTASGLTGNTSSTFTTSQLTAAENGLYFRVKITNQSGDIVYSDEDPNIGDRIIAVTVAPTITVLTEYDPSYSVGVGITELNIITEVVLLNADISTTTAYDNMTRQWQKSTDGGVTWTNISQGDSDGVVVYDTVQSVFQVNANPLTYGVRFILYLYETAYVINNYQYRLIITEPSASNSPLTLGSTTIIINPVISIYSHPGEALTDTDTTNCYKTSIANSGKAQFSCGALTTAGAGLGFAWEYSYLQNNGTYTDFVGIQEGINLYHFRLVPGTNSNESILQLDRMMYFEEFVIRCVVSGSSGETSITSNSHSVLMTDVVTLPSDLVSVNALEDYYGDIPNRSFFTNYAIETALFETVLDCSKNTGLNGDVTMVMQRQNPGSSTWSDVGITVTKTQTYSIWTPTPSLNDPAIDLDLSYQTPPLRIDIDNGAKYRVKVTSTAIYTLDGSGNKVLTEIYSTNDALLSVFRQLFITGQPTDSSVYPNFDASFAVTATTTSAASITYQWQYNTSNTTSGWVNIDASNAGTTYSGYNTNLLTIDSVTTSTAKYYRVVVNATGTLASVTSDVATLSTTIDGFNFITSINDFYVLEFENVTWSFSAQSFSLGTITYQWQKSTDYNPNNPSAATWSNISGANTNTYQILSVGQSDDAYYRCSVVSQGGFQSYTNVARLGITAVAIQITKDLASSFSVLEGATQAVTFSVDAISTIGNAPTYQWQYNEGSGWNNFGTGYQGQTSDGKSFIPNAFTRSQNGIQVRCKIDADSVPSSAYSSVATVTVNRRFTYFADSATKNVVDGDIFELNLNPTISGGTATYQWYRNGIVMSGENSSILSITATSTINGDTFKCLIGLPDCNQHRYSRNNADNIVSATASTFTVDVKLNIVAASTTGRGNAISYTNESVKTGAAIGTVICVAKPPGYVNNVSATTDDITQWSVAISGHESSSSSSSSTATSGTAYSANKPSWVTDSNYKSPKWSLNSDRFNGYLELRGQWLKKADFPALYRVIGDSYGVTSDSFRLPNPYGKKLLGTGNVDNNSGSVSIEPLFSADGTSGGDKNVPGSIGGVYNYVESKQLPPGSPGISSLPDGTAGAPDPSTFTLGNFSTDGFTEVEGTGTTTFSGTYSYKVGPMLPWVFNGPPEHSHSGISAGFVDGFLAHKGSCGGQGQISPTFYEVEPEGGSVLNGPEGISDSEKGREHTHALAFTAISPGNNASSTHGSGIGPSNGAGDTVSQTINMSFIPGSTTPSFNLFLEPAPITMTTASKAIFDAALKFTLRNNEGLPLLSPYFRLKYMIKAY